MDQKTVLYIVVGIVILIAIVGVVFAVKKKEGYVPLPTPTGTPYHQPSPTPRPRPENCSKGVYPPAPANVPPSAYAEILAPSVLSSAQNPETKPTMKVDPRGGYFYDFYSDKKVCNTPAGVRAYNNDSCAQYGIGEMAEGPPGEQFCVCESRLKTGEKVRPGQAVNASDIVIGIGGVCTENNQCCSQFCAPIQGQFSKMCSCPPGQVWSPDLVSCVAEFRPNKGGFSSMYDDHVESYRPTPVGAGLTTGKLCASHKDCSLGEACSPDNFCTFLGVDTTQRDSNLFEAGAVCQSSDQCTNNLICRQGTCACPPNTFYEISSRNCQCADGSKAYYNGQCIPPSMIPRKFCPTTPPAFARSWNECGLGERFNPGTGQCLCVTDLETIHPGKIEQAGRCESSSQCKAGNCQTVGGVAVCVEPQNSLFSLAVTEYL